MHLVGNVCFKKKARRYNKRYWQWNVKDSNCFFIFNEPLKKKETWSMQFQMEEYLAANNFTNSIRSIS